MHASANPCSIIEDIGLWIAAPARSTAIMDSGSRPINGKRRDGPPHGASDCLQRLSRAAQPGNIRPTAA
jgi:hypothetical protein